MKKFCEPLAATHVRRDVQQRGFDMQSTQHLHNHMQPQNLPPPARSNVYDQEIEYFVTIREKGTRKEQVSSEEKKSTTEAGNCVLAIHMSAFAARKASAIQ